MAATQVADGVWQVAGSNTNAFILTDGDDLSLVDSGYPGDRRRLVAALEHLGRSLADVVAVVVTHAHVDHIGSAEMLRQEHGAGILTHAAEAAQARGEKLERISTSYMLSRLWQPQMLRFVVAVIRAGALRLDHVDEVETFDRDAPLDVPGRPVAVFTPGHTSGHSAFHLPERGVLFTGDGLVTEDVLTRETGPRLLAPPFNHDQAQTVASLERLRGLAAEVVLPGHGAPFRGSPAEAVDQAVARLG